MRISSACGSLAVLLVSSSGLAAQTGPPPDHSSLLSPPLISETGTQAVPAPTWKHRVLTALGGAVLGAGAAFFVSQINQSDWEDSPGRDAANRGLWAAVGGGAGFALGFSFPLAGRGPPRAVGTTAAGGRSVITLVEIRGASVDNALDVVRLLRPEWLNTRPPDQLGETEAEGRAVYLDDFRYGDTDALRSIHVSTISSIRFVSASAATARWGPGNVMGVIQVIALP